MQIRIFSRPVCRIIMAAQKFSVSDHDGSLIALMALFHKANSNLFFGKMQIKKKCTTPDTS